MKNIAKIIAAILLTTLLAAAAPPSAFALGEAQVSHGGKIIFGENFTLKSGETLAGDLVIFGGNVTLEAGSTVAGSMAVIGGNVSAADGVEVTGDVVMMGGNLSMLGRLDGDMVMVGGSASLGASAVVNGDVTTVGGSLAQEPGAQILGRVQDNSSTPEITIPVIPPVTSLPDSPTIPDVRPGFNVDFHPFAGFLSTLGWALAVSLVAVVASLFLQPQMERVSDVITSQPLITGSFGLITVTVSVLALLIMTVTIILIPVSLLGIVILALAWLFGLAALGQEVGSRLAVQLKQSWTLPLSAGIGTLVLMLVVGLVSSLVPCIGPLAALLVGLAGLGGVVLTRFGSRDYPTSAPLPVEIPPAS